MSMSIFFNNRYSAAVVAVSGKIKRIFCAAALTVLWCILLPINASAAESNEIRLESNGGEAVLELCFPQAAAEEVASMQVSVSVKAHSYSVDLEFIPDSGLSSKIVESSYQNDTGILNIYLAGTDALFSSSEFITVGRIKISTRGNNAVSAAVEVVRDSVRFVRDGELVSLDNNTDYPDPVSITALGQSSPAVPDPVYPNRPSGNYFPNITVSTPNDSGRNDYSGTDEIRDSDRDGEDTGYGEDVSGGQHDSSELEEQEHIGENFNPPDMSSLQDALARAESYRKTDYTESSYDDLKEAVDAAKDIISDPNATQDEIDEALLNIENSIGMLKPVNDIPSGAEGYGRNGSTDMNGGINNGTSGDADVTGSSQGGQSQGGENAGHDDNGSDVQAVQGGNIVNASDGAQSVSGDPFTENGESSKSPVLKVIILAAIAVAAAVTAIIFLKTANKKKSGDRFKN